MSALLRLLKQLPRSCQLLIWAGLVFSCLSSLTEVLTLASVVPFLSGLANATKSDLSQHALTHSGRVFAVCLIFATVLRIFSLWLSSFSSARIGHHLASRVLRAYLCLPYETFLTLRSSDISSTAIQHCSAAALAFRNMLQFIQAALVSCALVVGLFTLQPFVALSVVICLSTVYSALHLSSRRLLDKWARVNRKSIADQLQSISEALGAIRDIQLDRAQTASVRRFSEADRLFRDTTSRIEVFAAVPRFVLEAVLLLSITLLSILLLQSDAKRSSDLIAILGAFALGGQRLIPSLQQCYASIAVIRTSQPALDCVLVALSQIPSPEFATTPLGYYNPLGHPSGNQCLRLENVSYTYPGSSTPALSGLTLSLSPGESLGIIGPTGCGKSTLLDLMMGLLLPQSGHISFNGHNPRDPSQLPINELILWRRNLAHVPQNVFIADTTLLSNIAFGVPVENIDYERVQASCAAAQIDQFIETLPERYNTLVGERGTLLSGGQRQRLGLARALYKGASLLILDEATSALDLQTETAVLEAISEIRSQKAITLIMVAHRVSTLFNCDRTIQLCKPPAPYKEFFPPYREHLSIL